MLILRRIVHSFSVLPQFLCPESLGGESWGRALRPPFSSFCKQPLLHRQNAHPHSHGIPPSMQAYSKDYKKQNNTYYTKKVMNISLEKTGTSAVITVKMEKADYQDAVKKELKHIAARVEMPGFRKGKAPFSFVEKRFGLQTKMEQVDKLLNKTLTDYISENKLNILGEPMVAEQQQAIDIEHADDFEFKFDVALAPEFEISLSADDHLPYYDIEITDEQVQEQVDNFARQAGHHENFDTYADGDIVRGVLAEQDAEGQVLEDGIHVEKASLMPKYFKGEAQKALFENAKVGDVMTINPSEAYLDNDSELASLLKISKDDVEAHRGNFTFQVEEISRFVPAALEQELFDAVFEDGEVTTEEQFRTKVRELLEKQRVADADYKFLIDFREYCKEKVGELDFPRELLKKFMLQSMKDKENAEQTVENEFEQSLVGLKWQLIQDRLVRQYEVKVSEEDIRETAVNRARISFLRYGIPNVPEEYVSQFADNMMKDEKQVRSIVDECIDKKLAATMKEVLSLDHKAVSLEEFQNFFKPAQEETQE